MAKFTLNLNGPLDDIPPSIKAASFDYVGRYQLIAETITRYFAASKTKPNQILDVGGLGSLLGQLLPIPLVVFDSEASTAESGAEQQGDGAHMAHIKDGSYDAVVTSDTLEHIPREDRKSFINELLRVSNDLVIICAPFNRSQGAVQEEAGLQDFYKNIVGQPDRWLQEHAEYGLPREKEILAHVPADISVATFHHSSLQLWRSLLSINLLANKLGNPELHKVVHNINCAYNDNVLFSDFAEDSYRTFIVLSKKHDIQLSVPSTAPAADSYLSLFRLTNDFYLTLLEKANELPVVAEEITGIRTDIDKAMQQIEEMVHSRSWRVTAPLRGINAKTPHHHNPKK
jgi:hypothetical protein